MDQREKERTCDYRLPLPPHKIASRQAHTVLRWALGDWCVQGEAADNVRVVLGELVTNALTHSTDVFTLALHLTDDLIVIEVQDSNDATPEVALPEGLAINGRGMLLVNALSKEWGVRQEKDGGKTVWAKVRR
jgi:anti-sigma regulatory factor (Ser/Thr protein kinase)